MVEKRIVTKNKVGEVVKIVEHHDLKAETRRAFNSGLCLGVAATVLVFAFALARYWF